MGRQNCKEDLDILTDETEKAKHTGARKSSSQRYVQWVGIMKDVGLSTAWHKLQKNQWREKLGGIYYYYYYYYVNLDVPQEKNPSVYNRQIKAESS